ncbi:extracellular solute-binding protein [Paenibacillus sp. GCM10028914]|uniref:extracellular solute-binding protein n=1 Tax=Paenibacillus sp. GCM10028914 TaxID=3273416 RepID=UPI00361C79CA
MMKKRASLIALMLSVTCATTIACSKQADPAPVKESPGTVPVTQEAKGPTEFTVMNIAWGTPPVDDNPQELAAEEKTNTKIKFNWVPAQDYLNRQNVALATGDISDVTQLQSSGLGLFGQEQLTAVEHGLFHDLTPYIKSPDFAKNYPNLAKFPDSLWEKVTYQGKIYGIPRDTAPEFFDGLWLREDLFKEAGLSVPTTIEELGEVIIKLSKPPERYGLMLSSPRLGTAEIAFTGVQGWGINENGDFIYGVFMPEYKDYLKWMNHLYVNKGIDPEFAINSQNSDFQAGKSAVMFHNWHAYVEAEIPHQDFTPEAKEKGAKAMQINPVKGPKGYTVSAARGFNRLTVISSKVSEEKIPGILKYIDFSGSEEYGDLIKFGVEGVHHEVKDGKKVVNEDKYKSDVVVSMNWFNHMYRDAQYWVNDFKLRGANQASVDQGFEIGKFEEKVFNESGILKDPTFSLYSSTANSKWAQLTKDMEDNMTKVIMGSMSIDQWDQYVAGLVSSDVYKTIQQEYKDANAAKQ